MSNGDSNDMGHASPSPGGLFDAARKKHRDFTDAQKEFRTFQEKNPNRIALYNKILNIDEASQADDWQGPSTRQIREAIDGNYRGNMTTAAWKVWNTDRDDLRETLEGEVDFLLTTGHDDWDLDEDVLYKKDELYEMAMALDPDDNRTRIQKLKHRINDGRAKVNRAAQEKIDFIKNPPGSFEFDFENVTSVAEYEVKLLVLHEALREIGLTEVGKDFLEKQFYWFIETGRKDVFNPFCVVNPPIDLADEEGGIVANTNKTIRSVLPEMFSQLQVGVAAAIERWTESQHPREDVAPKIEKCLINWRVRWFRIVVGNSSIHLDGGSTTDSHIQDSIEYGALNDPQQTGMVDVFGQNDWSDVEQGTKKLVTPTRRSGRMTSLGILDTLVSGGVDLWTEKDDLPNQQLASTIGWVVSVSAVADAAYNEWTDKTAPEMDARTVHSVTSDVITLFGNKEVHTLRRVYQSHEVKFNEYVRMSYNDPEAATELGKELVSDKRKLAYNVLGKAGAVLDCFSIYWDVTDGLAELEQGDTSVAIGKFVTAAAAGISTGLVIYGMMKVALLSGAGASWSAVLAASGPGGWIVSGALVLVSLGAWLYSSYTDDTALLEYLKNTAFGTAWSDDSQNKTDPGTIGYRFNTVYRLQPEEEMTAATAPLYEEVDEINWARQTSENPGVQFDVAPYESGAQVYTTSFEVSRNIWVKNEILLVFPLEPVTDLSDPTAPQTYREYTLDDWQWALRFDDLVERSGGQSRPVTDTVDVTQTPVQLNLERENPGQALTIDGSTYWNQDANDEYTQETYVFNVQASSESDLFGVEDPASGDKYLEAMILQEEFFGEIWEIADQREHIGFLDLVGGNFSNVKRDRAKIEEAG